MIKIPPNHSLRIIEIKKVTLRATTLKEIQSLRDPETLMRLLTFLGKTEVDEDPLTFDLILKSNGLINTLWIWSSLEKDNPETWVLARKFAERVLPVYEEAYPGDSRVRDMLKTELGIHFEVFPVPFWEFRILEDDQVTRASLAAEATAFSRSSLTFTAAAASAAAEDPIAERSWQAQEFLDLLKKQQNRSI